MVRSQNPNDTSRSPCIDLTFLALFEKAMITNLGIEMDPTLKLDRQVNVVVKSCFFHLRWSRLFFSKHNLETVIHALITSPLDYCNVLFFRISQF